MASLTAHGKSDGRIGGANLYAFCLNAPSIYFDPLGLLSFTDALYIAGGFVEGLGIGAENVGRAVVGLIESPYQVTVSISSAAGTLSTPYGREQAAMYLDLAREFIELFREDECFRRMVLEEFGEEAREYFSDPYKLSEFLSELAVNLPTMGTGGALKGAGLAGKNIAKLLKHLENARSKGKAARRLPDDANVVRGGRNMPEDIARGTGTHPSGVTGVSVESAPGLSVEELSANIPHGQVGTTTVGAVREAGGDVIPSD